MNYTDEELDLIFNCLHDKEVRVGETQTDYRRRWTQAALAKAASLRPGPEWISVKERRPTEEDGDGFGDVLWLSEAGVYSGHYIRDREGFYWMPCAPIAALPKRPIPEPKDPRDTFAALLRWDTDSLRLADGTFSAPTTEAMFQGFLLAREAQAMETP
jgi:hypothetical protein